MTAIKRPPAPSGQQFRPQIRYVSDGYSNALGVPIIAGRGLDSTDRNSSQPVVVLNQAAARAMFSEGKPLGQTIVFDVEPGDPPFGGTIVGIAGNIREASLSAPPLPTVYLPMAQHSFTNIGVIVRATRPADLPVVERGLRRSVAESYRLLAAYNLRSMTQSISTVVGPQTFQAILMSIFGVLAVLVTAVGVYGVVSHAVTQRTREIGIRIAVGASKARVFANLLGESARLSGVGLMIGCGIAVAAFAIARHFLSAVHGSDLWILVAAMATLFLATIAASLVPAARAMRIDPVRALRGE